jgi:S-adenosylmethionine/arginine decarboxylase-like enzyme
MMVDGLTEWRHTKRYLRRSLRDMVEMVGMRVIKGPKVEGKKRQLQGWVILAESHATIHVSGSGVHVDLFSCKYYDTAEPLAFIVARLRLTNVMWQVVERPMPEPKEGRV